MHGSRGGRTVAAGGRAHHGKKIHNRLRALGVGSTERATNRLAHSRAAAASPVVAATTFAVLAACQPGIGCCTAVGGYRVTAAAVHPAASVVGRAIMGIDLFTRLFTFFSEGVLGAREGVVGDL